MVIKKAAVFLTAVLLTAGLLLQNNIPAFAEEPPAAEGGLTETLAAPSGERDPRIMVYGASLPYVGEASVLAIHINFPNDTADPVNQKHTEEDNEDALKNALTYLRDYYARASYGKLDISGETVLYNAEKPRGEYEGPNELLGEALQNLDASVDFSSYDGNHDQIVDCIYMHIPYNNKDVRNTPWWSNCSTYNDQETLFDGMRIGSRLLINRPLSGDGLSIFTHETGHAMGFTDYYSNSSGTADLEYLYLTGTLTFDMMDNNIGDHNGFSKWIAGWLTDEDVTMVTANENGVSAVRGGKPVGIRNEDGSLTLDLSSFDTDVIHETGGIIVVGNDFGDDPSNAVFSNYYMLQYETFAGNQKVYYRQYPEKPLSSGFRVYRVQAELSPDGYPIHRNTSGKLFDKLVELVDHDYKEYHVSQPFPYPSISTDQDKRYGCMYYAGDLLTPLTDPSTNFKENRLTGFTGIYMEFLESEGDHGSVKIWYSDEEKPAQDIPFEFSLDTIEAFPGGCDIVLTANQDVAVSPIIAKLTWCFIDEKYREKIHDIRTEGNTIRFRLYLDADILKKDSRLQLVFRDDSFILSGGRTTKEFIIDMPVSLDLVDLTESGFIPGPEDENNLGWNLSQVVRGEDGTFYFYEYMSWKFIDQITKPVKYSFTSGSPTEITVTEVDSEDADYKDAEKVINARIDQDHTENAAIVPEGAQLGDFTHICDAVKIGDHYYVASYTEIEEEDEQPRFAVSKLDAKGNLIRQETPAGSDFNLSYADPDYSRALIQKGPNKKLAVSLFNAIQNRPRSNMSLENHGGTFFFDLDLNLEGRLDNFSTGCGTWLDDGRYISFSQRSTEGYVLDEDFDYYGFRQKILSYDITGVIDPPQEPAPEDDEGKGADNTSGNTPETGDENRLILWIVLMAAVLCVLMTAVLILRSGRRQSQTADSPVHKRRHP